MYALSPWILRASCGVHDIKVRKKTEEARSYVFGQPEAVPILLRVLEMELLVQLKLQPSAHTSVLLVEGIADLWGIISGIDCNFCREWSYLNYFG